MLRDEFSALVAVAARLRAGDFGFSMGAPGACIGAFLYQYENPDADRNECIAFVESIEPGNPLHALVYPTDLSPGWWPRITGAHAAQAIENYIEYGEPAWHGVIFGDAAFLAEVEQKVRTRIAGYPRRDVKNGEVVTFRA